MPEPRAHGDRDLSGPEKAAALLLMMDKPPAGRLLKQFDQSDLRAVARAAAGLGAIPATTLDRIVEEFAAGFSVGADLLGDAGQAKNLLAEALPPEQIADILDSELGEANQLGVWQSLAQAPESAIIELLMAERRGDGDLHPFQTRSLGRDQNYRRAAARSTQRRPVRDGQADRRDAARRGADRKGGAQAP